VFCGAGILYKAARLFAHHFFMGYSYNRKRFPPGSLLAAANNRLGPNDDTVKALLPSISMFQNPPAWSTAAEAPNDWALLQRAKELRLQKAQVEGGDTREPESEPESSQNKPDLTDYPLAVAAAGLAPPSYNTMPSLLFGFVALLVVGLLLLVSATTTTSFSNVATEGVGPIKLFPTLSRPAEKELSGPKFFLPSAKRQTKKILGLGVPTLAGVGVDNDTSSAPVTANNSADIDTKPTTAVPSIVEVSTFPTTSPFLDSYYALGSCFVVKGQHVWSLLRRQLVKLQVVWDDNAHALGSFLADKPQHVGSLLRRQLVKLQGVVSGILVVPIP
jgi:hypothetical protein